MSVVALVLVAAGTVGCGSPALAPIARDAGSGGVAAGGGGGAGQGTGGASTTGGSGGAGPGGSGGATGTGGGGAGAACAPVPAADEGTVCTDLLITTTSDVAAAQACAEVTGSVVISPLFVGTVDLPQLRRVGKDVRRENAKAAVDPTDPAQTTRVRLPNVTFIGGDLWFYLDFNLTELDLRSVEAIGGRAWVYRDTEIHTLRLDALHQVARDFYIADVFRLPDCVAKDIASHVTTGESSSAIGRKTPANCHCERVCNHVEERCP